MKKVLSVILASVIMLLCSYTQESGTASTTENIGDDMIQADSSESDWDEEETSDYNEEEDIQPEYDYDPAAVAEKAELLNKTADSIRDEICLFLTNSASGGYGMNPDGEGTYMSIYIEDGLWTVSVTDTGCFGYTEEMEWFGYGEADSTTDETEVEEPDTLLAIALAKRFPEIENGSAGAWLQDGSCKAAYFTEDTTSCDGQMDYMMGDGGWTSETCEWDGYNQGMSDEGNIVGTSPVLKFAVEE